MASSWPGAQGPFGRLRGGEGGTAGEIVRVSVKRRESRRKEKEKLKIICVSVALGYVSLPVLMLMSHLVCCMCLFFVLICFFFLLNKREKCVYFWQFKVM